MMSISSTPFRAGALLLQGMLQDTNTLAAAALRDKRLQENYCKFLDSGRMRVLFREPVPCGWRDQQEIALLTRTPGKEPSVLTSWPHSNVMFSLALEGQWWFALLSLEVFKSLTAQTDTNKWQAEMEENETFV